jgi:phosphate:Na+ symporter
MDLTDTMNDSVRFVFSILPMLLGGVGLFLSGMILMSDGLKAAAGGRLQRILERSTGTPLTAFGFGVGLTAVVQSSSATTITTIGFVSAGLLSFASAIGVIIGANVGTTSTGWIVALLGFKLNVGAIALPFVGVGALMRLLGDSVRGQLGMALVGFGLIFIGIDFLQDGMGGVAQSIDLSLFAQPTLLDYLSLVLIGGVMTVVLQSSSAAVALTLTALFSGAIGLEQAAYLVIGQNLGTTVKAVLAAMGASIPAKRTALAHILFNVGIGLLAFLLVQQLLALAIAWAEWLGEAEPAVILAIFHTLFNVMGAALFLPFTGPFARLIERLIPDRGPVLTRHLDRSLLEIPDVAVEAASRALQEIFAVTLGEAASLLRDGAPDRHSLERLHAAQAAMDETGRFLGQIRFFGDRGAIYARRLALLHAGDHVDRLIEACQEQRVRSAEPALSQSARQMARVVEQAEAWMQSPLTDGVEIDGVEKNGVKMDGMQMVEQLAAASTSQAETRRQHRAHVLEETAAGRMQPDQAQRQLEAMRWVDRIGYHAWRTLHHLAGPPEAAATLHSTVYPDPQETSG